MSRITHSTHDLLPFVSAPVSFCTSLGSHFSLLFLFFCDLFPLPSSLAAAAFSDRSWQIPTAPLVGQRAPLPDYHAIYQLFF